MSRCRYKVDNSISRTPARKDMILMKNDNCRIVDIDMEELILCGVEIVRTGVGTIAVNQKTFDGLIEVGAAQVLILCLRERGNHITITETMRTGQVGYIDFEEKDRMLLH